MKTVNCLLILMVTASPSVFSENFGKTRGDIYTDSYAAQMRNQMRSQSAAEIRAGEYRARYDRCDEHHLCENVTAVPVKQSSGTLEKQEPADAVNPFLFTPAWQ